MASVHVFRANWQPLTDFVDCSGEKFGFGPRERFVCRYCGDTRTAKNLEIMVYYDRWDIRCKGGKHPGWR